MSNSVQSNSVSTNSEYIKKLIYTSVAVIIGLAIKFALAPVNGLTPTGASVLAIFSATIFMWIFVGSDWPSLLAIMALVIFQALPLSTALSTSFGSVIGISFIPFFVLSGALRETGVLKKLAYWFISRKIVKGRPWVFVLLYNVAIFVTGMFANMIIASVLFATISDTIGTSLGYTKKDKFYRMLMMCTLWAAGAAESVFPFGKSIPLAGLGMMTNLGYDISFAKYLLVGIPFGILLMLIEMIVLRVVFRPDTSKFENYNVEAIQAEMREIEITKSGKFIIFVYLFVIISFLLPAFTFMPTIAKYFSSFSIVVFPVLACVIFSIIPIEGKPIINLNESLSRVPWGLVIFICTIMMFSSCMSMDSMGIKTMFANLLAPIAASVTPGAIAIVAISICLALTNIMSNMVSLTLTITAFVPIIVSYASNGSVTPVALAACLIMVADVAVLLPSASPVAPITLGDFISVKETFTYSLLFLILTLLAVCYVCLPIANMIFPFLA